MLAAYVCPRGAPYNKLCPEKKKKKKKRKKMGAYTIDTREVYMRIFLEAFNITIFMHILWPLRYTEIVVCVFDRIKIRNS